MSEEKVEEEREICSIRLALLENDEVDMLFEWEDGEEDAIGQFLFRLHTGQTYEPMTEELLESSNNLDSTEKIIDVIENLFELQKALKVAIKENVGDKPVISPSKVFNFGGMRND